MASEWALKRVLDAHLCGFHCGDDSAICCCGEIAAALDAALAEGRKEALGSAIPLKDLMAEAMDEARAEGRATADHERRQRDELQAYVNEDLIPTQAKLQADLERVRTEAARWAEQREELAGLLTAEQERARGLQADLDAALTCLLAWEPSVLSWCQRHPQAARPEAVAAYERIEALLNKRREP